MDLRRYLILPVLVSCVILIAAALSGATTYTQIDVIPVPGAPLKSFDISWFERSTKTYYLADRSNAAVDVVNATDDTFLGRFKGFVGFRGANEVSGPNGVVVAHPEHELWATDGDSTVKVFDLSSRELLATISTGGSLRADELAFDQEDHVLLVANGDDAPPFVSLISVRDRTVVGTINFPDATNGLEQPVFDPVTHRFYLAVPQIGSDPLMGGIAVINPDTRKRERTFPVKDCQPNGLTLGPDQHLLLGCSGDAIEAGAPAQSIVMSARDGSIVATIKQVGGSDQVWFNPGDKRYYLAARSMPGGPVLGVIDAVTNTWIANAPTGPNAHSVAADPINNHIFVPIRGLGIAVYAAEEQ